MENTKGNIDIDNNVYEGGARSFVSERNVARMPTDRYASEYNMRHKYRGKALIFNQEHFDAVLRCESRNGTNVDRQNLLRTLKGLHFEVDVYDDSTLCEMSEILYEASQEDYSDCDCIMVVILSHGGLGYIYTRDAKYKLDSVWSFFTADRCPTLAGKPKLFFIQACQGNRLDDGVVVHRTETDGDFSTSYTIPIHSDFLIAFSTPPGFYSWRNCENGTWFIQSLCEELRNNGKSCDLISLLTNVNRSVATNFQSKTPNQPSMHEKKQIPCITSTLTRSLYFTEKE